MAKDRLPAETWQFVAERDYGCAGNRFGYAHQCSGPTVVHHRLMRSQGGGHEPENLVALCNAAHLHVHANPTESYENGLLLHPW